MKRNGQAMLELAVGMLALALTVSALCGFATYIVKSLRIQNGLRRVGGTASKYEHLDVGDFTAKYVFGVKSLELRERVVMPTLEFAK